jgi:hypothetical protein
MRMRFGFLRFYVRIIYLFEFYHEIRMIKGRDRGLECVVECVEVRLQDTCSDDQLHRLSYLRPSLPTLGSDGSLPYASAGGRREQTNTNKQRILVNFSISKNSMAQENFQYFPFFWQKISVVLNCTSRSEKSLQYSTVLYTVREAAWNRGIKVDLPPPVHFSKCTTRFPYKTYGGK